jgi:quinol monooxygenase YgiN
MRIPLFVSLALAIVSSAAAPAARAADAGTAYVVTYFETVPTDTGKARSLLRQFAQASRKESGNLRIEILQRIGQPDQFVILEAWKDQDAQAAHAAAIHARQFRERLASLLRGPYDERPHTALAVGPVNALPASESAKAAVYAVTHVDIVPTQREVGTALVKRLSEDGRNDTGNVRFEALTQSSRTNHMTVVEIWPDRKAADAFGMAASKRDFREKLMPLSGSLYDERLYRTIN